MSSEVAVFSTSDFPACNQATVNITTNAMTMIPHDLAAGLFIILFQFIVSPKENSQVGFVCGTRTESHWKLDNNAKTQIVTPEMCTFRLQLDRILDVDGIMKKKRATGRVVLTHRHNKVIRFVGMQFGNGSVGDASSCRACPFQSVPCHIPAAVYADVGRRLARRNGAEAASVEGYVDSPVLVESLERSIERTGEFSFLQSGRFLPLLDARK